MTMWLITGEKLGWLYVVIFCLCHWYPPLALLIWLNQILWLHYCYRAWLWDWWKVIVNWNWNIYADNCCLTQHENKSVCHWLETTKYNCYFRVEDQIHIKTMPTNNLNNKNFLIILILIILLLFMVIKDNRYKLLKLSSHDFNNISDEIWSAFLSNIKSEGWD